MKGVIMAKYLPGTSGNSAGRPKGIPNKRTQLAAILESHAADLGIKAVQMALTGDVQALRLCIERLLPKVAHAPLEFELPEQIDFANTAEVKNAILRAALAGKITSADAVNLSTLLSDQFGNVRPYVPCPQIPSDPVEAARVYREFMLNS
jgi:hypothetical protein